MWIMISVVSKVSVFSNQNIASFAFIGMFTVLLESVMSHTLITVLAFDLLYVLDFIIGGRIYSLL